MNNQITEKAVDIKSEVKTLRNWLEIKNHSLIATHQDVDADAAFSAALLKCIKPKAGVIFVRADSEISDPKVIAVDLMNGKSAIKGLDAGSAFGLIVNELKFRNKVDYNSLKDWADQLNLTDQAKKCNDRVVLAGMVNAWKAAGLDDSAIVGRACELLQGMLKIGKRRVQQRMAAKKIPINNNVAVVGPDDHVRSADLFARGALAVVRKSKDGIAVLLSKRAREMGVNLTQLNDEQMDGWFFHPGGFIASFGGKKAPKNPDDSKVTMKILAEKTRKLVVEAKK